MCWEGHGPSEQLGCDSWADVLMSCGDLASGMWSGWFSCEREKLWQVETGLIPEMNKFKNVNTAFSSFFLLFVPRWCKEVRAVLVAGLAVCVCVCGRQVWFIKFQRETKNPCVSQYLWFCFLPPTLRLFLLYGSEGVLIDGGVVAVSERLKGRRKKDWFVDHSRLNRPVSGELCGWMLSVCWSFSVLPWALLSA